MVRSLAVSSVLMKWARARLAWLVAILLVFAWAITATSLWVMRVQPLAPVWGTVADWTMAVVTSLALGAAIWAGRAAYGQLQLMRVDVQARQVEGRERQARMVFAMQRRILMPDGSKRLCIMIHNRSDAPIRQVEMSLHGPNNMNGFSLGMVEPTPDPVEVDIASDVANGALKEMIGRFAENSPGLAETLADLMEFGLAVTFTDAYGNRWQRLTDHSLVMRNPGFGDWDARQAAHEHWQAASGVVSGEDGAPAPPAADAPAKPAS